MNRCNTKPKSSTATGAKSASCCAGAKSAGSPGCATGSQGSSESAAPKLPSACAPTDQSSGSAATGASAAPGSSPIGQRVAAWDEMLPRAAPLIERFGQKVAAGVLGVGTDRFWAFEAAMAKRGVRYLGERIHKRSPEQLAQAIREAAAWEAAGRPGAVSAPAAAPVNPAAGRQVVIPPGVRITVAPPFVDRRWAPDPGYVESFRLAGIGRDVQTGEVWE